MRVHAPLLRVDGLTVQLRRGDRRTALISDVSFELETGRTLCVVGESGSGKSVTALAIMRLLAEPALQISAGSIKLQARELVGAGEREMEEVRGGLVSIVFQDPMSALNPVLTIGRQMAEPLRLHLGLSGAQVWQKSVELLRRVGIPSPETALQRYPHQLSGGQRQRVLIAIALACNPRLLIADEPTTALDVTTQAQILDLLGRLQEQLGMGLILITHDLGVVAEMADDVAVMYAGRLVEKGPAADIFERPAHPYTRGLLQSIPPFDGVPTGELPSIPGAVPSAFEMPSGCAFAPRCSKARAACTEVVPAMVNISESHSVACVFAAAEAS